MLFDLRSRGRRGTVKVVYIVLAAIFLLGFVGLGVGGGVGSTGILSSLTGHEGAGGGPNYTAEISKYQKLTERQPRDFAAWEKLLHAQLLLSGGEAYTSPSAGITSKGKELFKQIAQTWSGYTAQNPPKPSLELAKEMLNVFGEEGLNEPSSAVEVLQTIVAAEPNSTHFYAYLADYAYKAHNTRVGDLASEKAVALAPASERTRLKNELAEVKANPSGEKTYTTTTDGKTFTGKLNSKGEVHAQEVKTTPAKTGSTSSSSK